MGRGGEEDKLKLNLRRRRATLPSANANKPSRRFMELAEILNNLLREGYFDADEDSAGSIEKTMVECVGILKPWLDRVVEEILVVEGLDGLEGLDGEEEGGEKEEEEKKEEDGDGDGEKEQHDMKAALADLENELKGGGTAPSLQSSEKSAEEGEEEKSENGKNKKEDEKEKMEKDKEEEEEKDEGEKKEEKEKEKEAETNDKDAEKGNIEELGIVAAPDGTLPPKKLSLMKAASIASLLSNKSRRSSTSSHARGSKGNLLQKAAMKNAASKEKLGKNLESVVEGEGGGGGVGEEKEEEKTVHTEKVEEKVL